MHSSQYFIRHAFALLFISRTLFSSIPEADLIAFSYNRPMQLYALLESVEKRVSQFRKIAVLCRTDPFYQKQYALVKERFPEVSFVMQSDGNDFKPLLMKLLFGDFGKGTQYVAFAVDDIIVTDEINIQKGIEKIEQTGAYALYYRLGPHISYFYMLDRPQRVPPLLDVGNGYFGWKFDTAEYEWAYPNTVDFALYRKESLLEPFNRIDFKNPSELEGLWASLGCSNPFGLCERRAKTINIPINIVSQVGWANRANHRFSTEELNQLFSIGLKIDIDQFYQVINSSVHVDWTPSFIQRF